MVSQQKKSIMGGKRREWAGLRPFPGYSVSTDGLVKSGTNRIAIRKMRDGTPYVLVKASGTNQELPVNLLVAIGWLGGLPPRGYRVIHRNGDIGDCHVRNLAWVRDSDYWFEFYRELMRVPAYYAPGLIKRAK